MGCERNLIEGNIVGAAGCVLAKLDLTDRVIAERPGLAEHINPGVVEPHLNLTGGFGDPNVNLEFVPGGTANIGRAAGAHARYFVAIAELPYVADVDAQNRPIVVSTQLQHVYSRVLTKYLESDAIV